MAERLEYEVRGPFGGDAHPDVEALLGHRGDRHDSRGYAALRPGPADQEPDRACTAPPGRRGPEPHPLPVGLGEHGGSARNQRARRADQQFAVLGPSVHGAVDAHGDRVRVPVGRVDAPPGHQRGPEHRGQRGIGALRQRHRRAQTVREVPCHCPRPGRAAHRDHGRTVRAGAGVREGPVEAFREPGEGPVHDTGGDLPARHLMDHGVRGPLGAVRAGRHPVERDLGAPGVLRPGQVELGCSTSGSSTARPAPSSTALSNATP